MSSVTSAVSGITDLLQTFGSNGSAALSSVLSSSSVQSSLQKASPIDIVQLSEQAVQLQLAGSLFGTPSSPAATPSSAAQTPAEREATDLFGTGAGSYATSGGNSTINLLG